jgi:hypothetical protein
LLFPAFRELREAVYTRNQEVSFSGLAADIKPLCANNEVRPRIASYDIHENNFFESILISEDMNESFEVGK